MVKLKTEQAWGQQDVVLAEPSSPVFILGAPCSDAASLATSLTASKDFWTSTESHLLYSLAGPDEDGEAKLHAMFQKASVNESFWLSKNRVVFPEFASFIGLGIDQMFLSRSNKKRWVEASSENTLIAPDLSYMFPKARFIHLLRDGRDVVALMLKHGMQEDSEEGFTAACEMWNIYVQRGQEFQEMFPDKVLEIRHEELVHNVGTQALCIMEFLGGAGAAAVGKYFTAQSHAFQERLWEDWDRARRELFVGLCAGHMTEVGYV